ncbi:ETC complex I subunit conserved region-domain-containing protein [Rhypophila decipiens]|uniref:ETC complex I subunit conserved region-domain-containing protein n=1 Tax=Rhypophila decipiens TaxID=261697 RepID=A0AAN6YHN1_9PEZI|nr:ETC complex I subunit conserved region-domain-containing protein [Rhypophila decipiens]
MRRTFRLLASVKPARYLEPGTPTGLTGLRTHTSPRATLLYLYSSTLDKLQSAPEHSLYRQSVEALTKHRKSLVESVVPEGFAEWEEKAAKLIADHPDLVNSNKRNSDGSHRVAVADEKEGRTYIISHVPREMDQRALEWDGEVNLGPAPEGSRTLEERRAALSQGVEEKSPGDAVEWIAEPMLTADQISQLEHKIGAGLIEEVIQVAEGELKLVDTMLQAKVWESLEEQPREGQWTYWARKE